MSLSNQNNLKEEAVVDQDENLGRDEMDRLYSETLQNFEEGAVVDGTVIAVLPTEVVVDIGYKSEGHIAKSEFSEEEAASLKPGDRISVYLEEREDAMGNLVLSKEKADRMKVWDSLEALSEKGEVLEGKVISRMGLREERMTPEIRTTPISAPPTRGTERLKKAAPLPKTKRTPKTTTITKKALKIFLKSIPYPEEKRERGKSPSLSRQLAHSPIYLPYEETGSPGYKPGQSGSQGLSPLIRSFDRQANLSLALVDLHDTDLKLGSYREKLIKPLSVGQVDLTDMNKALNPLGDFHEEAKIHNLCDLALHGLTDLEALGDIRLPRIGRHLLVPQGKALTLLFNFQDNGLNLLSLLEHFGGVANMAGPGKIRNMNQSINPFIQTDKDTKVGKALDLSGDDRPDRVAIFNEIPGIGAKLFETEGNLPVLLVDLQNLGLDGVPDSHDLARMLDLMVPAHLRDVHQAFDSRLNFQEGAVIRDRHNLRRNLRAFGITGSHRAPGITLELFETKGDATCLLVMLQHHHIDLVTNGHKVLWARDPTP